MDAIILNKILEKHKKWLKKEDGGERADLCGAILRGADLKNAELTNAELIGANLEDADMSFAKLNGADLRAAKLEGVNLRFAEMRGTNLKKTHIRKTDFSYADMAGADLSGAVLEGPIFDLAWTKRKIKIDTEVAKVLLYELMCPCIESENVSEEFKRALFTKELIEMANQSTCAGMRAYECRLIRSPLDEQEEHHG